jgi:hypothetical protein
MDIRSSSHDACFLHRQSELADKTLQFFGMSGKFTGCRSRIMRTTGACLDHLGNLLDIVCYFRSCCRLLLRCGSYLIYLHGYCIDLVQYVLKGHSGLCGIFGSSLNLIYAFFH